MKTAKYSLWAALGALLILAGCQSATDDKKEDKVATYASASDAIKAKALGGLGAIGSGVVDGAEAISGTPYDTETLDVSATISGTAVTYTLTLTAYDVEGTTYTGTATLTEDGAKNHWKGELALGGAGTGTVAYDLDTTDTETTEGTVTTTTTVGTGTITVDGTPYTLDNFTLDVTTEDTASTDEDGEE